MKKSRYFFPIILALAGFISLSGIIIFVTRQNRPAQIDNQKQTIALTPEITSIAPGIKSNIAPVSSRVTLKAPANFSLEIPEAAIYSAIGSEDENWGIEIASSNLDITYCVGCDWLGEDCGGLGLDNCSLAKSAIGNQQLSEYYLKSDPGYLVRVVGDLKIAETKTVTLFIKTKNHQKLTIEEMGQVGKINSSIKTVN